MSFIIIKVINSKGIRWAEHGRDEGKKLLERPRRGGRIILQWILRKYVLRIWTGFFCFMVGTRGWGEGSCNDPLGSTRGRVFLD